jgi:hypothetical protein
MIWGEILANLLIGILGWLFLNGVLQAEYVHLHLHSPVFKQRANTS